MSYSDSPLILACPVAHASPILSPAVLPQAWLRGWAQRLRAGGLPSLCLLLSLAASTPLRAQSSGTPEGEQRRQQERQTQLREQQERQPDVHLSPARAPAQDTLPAERPCFVLDDVQLLGVQGQPVPEFQWLHARLQSLALRQCLGLKGLTWLLDQAQNELIGRGYVTTRVLAGAQDLAQGGLVLSLLPGRIHAIRLADPESRPVYLRNALPMREGDLLNLRDIEQALENLKRLPSVEAEVQIEPAVGEALDPGLSDLVLRYREARPLRLSMTADDSGTRATGTYQASITLSVDQPLRLHDLFYLSLNHDLGGGDSGAPGALGPRGTRGHTAHYDLPLGNSLLGLSHSRNTYHQSVAGATQTYLYRGNSENQDITLTHLVHRDATQKLLLSLQAFQRKSNNAIDDTDIEVQRRVVGGWAVTMQHKAFWGAMNWDATLGYKRGTGAFGALAAPEQAFGEGTSRFALFSADLHLNATFRPGTQTLRYSGNWRLQSPRTPLTPQDRFALGGRYTVRGFDGESLLSAERGWLWRNDLGLVLNDRGHELYVALDHGEVGGPSSQALLGRRLSGAVLGWRGRLQALQFDVFLGGPLRKPEHFPGSHSVSGFSLMASF